MRDIIVHTEADILLQELISMLEQSSTETEKIRVLKSMGNCGSKELISSIKRTIEDKSQPPVVRTQAVFALRKIAKPFPKQVQLSSEQNKTMYNAVKLSRIPVNFCITFNFIIGAIFVFGNEASCDSRLLNRSHARRDEGSGVRR